MNLDQIGTFHLPPAVQSFLESRFNQIFVKDFQFSTSFLGDNGFYSCSVISKERLFFEIPGTSDGQDDGILFILNPDHQEGDTAARSVFPISVGYNWKILAYLRTINLSIEEINGQSIGQLAETLFDLGLRVLRLSDRQVLAHAISVFSNSNFSNTDSIDQFIVDYNNYVTEKNDSLPPENHLLSISPISGEDRIGQLLEAIENSISGNEDYSFLKVLLEFYILEFVDSEISINQTKSRLNKFFRALIPAYDLESYLKDLLLPKFSASLELSAAIEFPRHMLTPVSQTNDNGVISFSETNPNEKYTLFFHPARFEYHSERGFISDVEIQLTSSIPGEQAEINYAKISKLPVYLGISAIKLDISDEKNISEANADGRPISFKGIYVDTAVVYLPSGFKVANGSSGLVSLKAERALIGHNGSERPSDMVAFGVSGRFFLDRDEGILDPYIAQIGSLTIRFDEFDLVLHQNQVESFSVAGSILFPESDTSLLFTGQASVEGDVVSYVITANLAEEFLIGNVQAQLTAPIVISFNENGVSEVSGSLRLQFPVDEGTDNLVELYVNLLYVAESGSVQLTVDGFSPDVSFEIGPLGIDPETATLGIGSGGIDNLSLSCNLSIAGIMSESNPSAVAQFPAIISYSEVEGFSLSLSSAQPEGITAKLFGFEIVLNSLELSYLSGGSSSGEGNGKLRIPNNNNGFIELDFTLTKIANIWTLNIANTSQFEIGNAKLQFESSTTQSAFRIEFDENGILNANARALLTLDALSAVGDAPEQPIIILGSYNALTSKIEFLADFGNQTNSLEFNLGPLRVMPKSAKIIFGDGKFEGALGTDIIISGLEDEQNPGNEKLFFASIELRNEYNRVLLLEANPVTAPNLTSLPGAEVYAVAPNGMKGTAAGVGLEIDLFDIRFNSNGILADSKLAGNIIISREQDEPQMLDPNPIRLGYAIEVIDSNVPGDKIFRVSASSEEVIDFNGFTIAFKKEVNNVEQDSELIFEFTKNGIANASANLKIVLNPSGSSTSGNTSDPVVIFISGVYVEVTSTFNFNASLDSAAIQIGSVTVEPEEFGFAISQGKLSGASLTASLKFDDCKETDGTEDKSFQVTLGLFSQYMEFSLSETQSPEERQAKLRGFSLRLNQLSIRLNSDFSGFYVSEGWVNEAAAILTIPRANDQVSVEVIFSFSSNGYSLALASEDPIVILDSNAVYIDLDSLIVTNDEDGFDFEIGGHLEIDSQIPAIESVIPRFIEFDAIGINQEGESRTFTFEGNMTWEGGYTFNLGSEDSGLSFYVPLDGLSSTLGEKVILDKLLISVTPVSGQFESDNTIEVSARFNWLGLEFGPVYAVASGAGMKAIIEDAPNLASQNELGSLGQTKLNFEIIKPNGLGLVIDAGIIVGGGYLYLDNENERYLGWLTLDIGDLGLDAIAIYSKTPTGFSFLGLVTVSFPKPIPLVFGFYLRGVGGLIGLHRGISTDALRQGIRSGTLDQVLFPENIVTQFQTILDSLEGYFPTAQGRHSFGLLFDLSYGQSKMITLELGLFASFPSPIIIALAGTLKVRVPEEDGKKFLLNCAFIGMYDEARKLISFDATIYDSLLANSMPLSGDIAARFGWGSNKVFLITVGGFHPDFVPDVTWNLPELRRMSVRFRDTEELKVITESYFAVTSNTFQAGARFEARYKKQKIEAIAYSGFDALFFFNPFRFTVQVNIGAEVAWRGMSVAGVNAAIYLTGPGRWNARGNASVEIAKFEVRVNFDISWGNDSGDSLPAINVKNLLIEEIQKNSSWNTPSLTDNAVTTKKIDDDTDELIVSPFSVLQVNQELIPLDYTVNKYGENPSTTSEVYQLSNLRIGSNPNSPSFETVELTGYFAPNQYKSLNESERLAAASFELLQSGIKATDDSFSIEIPTHFTQSSQQYQVIIANESEPASNSIVQVFDNLDHLEKVSGGAIGKHRSYRMQARKLKKAPKVKVNPVHYRAVDASSLSINPSVVANYSKARALDYLERMAANNGEFANLKIVSKGTYGRYLNEVYSALQTDDIDR
jgi:hypothetical protein